MKHRLLKSCSVPRAGGREVSKVRQIEEILADIKTQNDIPAGYELLEIYAFLCLKKTILMYQNNQLTKEQSQNIKKKIEAEYEQRKKEYAFRNDLYEKYINDISKTEDLRIKVRLMLKEEAPVTEGRLAETLGICLQLIELYSGEKW